MDRKTAFLLAFLGATPAAAMPDKTLITVDYHPDEITYIHKNMKISCAQNKQGKVVLGCARDKKEVQMAIDCPNRRIKIDVFGKNRQVEIFAGYPKGSCEYREVLDHEMTHMNLHVTALENVVQDGMERIVDAFNAAFDNGRNCRGAISAAEKQFNVFSEKYSAQDRRINNEFDRNDEDSVLLNCKTPPKVKITYRQPEMIYMSADNIDCAHRYVQNEPELSCSAPVSFTLTSDVKPYLASVSAEVKLPAFKTMISSRYRPSSCEYKALATSEATLVDRIEDVIYDQMELAEIAAKKVYNEMLAREASGAELSAAVIQALQRRFASAGQKIDELQKKFRSMSVQDLKRKCH